MTAKNLEEFFVPAFGDIAAKIIENKNVTWQQVEEKLELELGAEGAGNALKLLDKPQGFPAQLLGALVRAITSDEEEQKELLLAYITPKDATKLERRSRLASPLCLPSIAASGVLMIGLLDLLDGKLDGSLLQGVSILFSILSG